MKTIIDLKGEKRFKKDPNERADSLDGPDLQLDMSDPEKARQLYRKMNMTTKHEQTFGFRPKA